METKVTLRAHESELETLVDRYGLSAVLMQLGSICVDKADHIRASYQDESLARSWERAGGSVARAAGSDVVSKVSP